MVQVKCDDHLLVAPCKPLHTATIKESYHFKLLGEMIGFMMVMSIRVMLSCLCVNCCKMLTAFVSSDL